MKQLNWALTWTAIFWCIFEFHRTVTVAETILIPLGDLTGRMRSAEKRIATNRFLTGLDSVSIQHLKRIQFESIAEQFHYKKMKEENEKNPKSVKGRYTKFYFGAK